METDFALNYGDQITLRHGGGTLSTVGILSDEVVLGKEGSQFENSIWEVYVQNQYSAFAEYEEVLLSQLHYELAPNAVEILSQLRRAASNEKKLNEKLMIMKYGKPVSFGDVIQLRHVKSKKFLMVNSFVLAKNERENLQVTLDMNGNSMSWFDIIPKSKFDHEGQRITNNSELILRVHDKPNEFIHCAKKVVRNISPYSDKEINCSLETSIWQIQIFHTTVDITSHFLLTRQLVTFHDPESSAYMTVKKKSFSKDWDVNVAMTNLKTMSRLDKEWNVGSSALWLIERDDMFSGGSLSYNSELLLRHFNTGMYLRLCDSKFEVIEDRKQSTKFQFKVSTSISTDNSKSNAIMNDSTIDLYAGDSYLSISNAIVNNGASASLTIENESSKPRIKPTLSRVDSMDFANSSILAASYQFNDLSANGTAMTEISRDCKSITDVNDATHVVVSSSINDILGTDLYIGVETASFLTSFINHVNINESNVASDNYYAKQFFRTLDGLNEFLNEKKILPHTRKDNDTLKFSRNDFDISKSKVHGMRQALMKEQGVLDLILDIVELCNNGVFEYFNMDRIAKSPRSGSINALSKKSMRRLISQMSSNIDDGDIAISSGAPPQEKTRPEAKVGLSTSTGNKVGQVSMPESVPGPPPSPKAALGSTRKKGSGNSGALFAPSESPMVSARKFLVAAAASFDASAENTKSKPPQPSDSDHRYPSFRVGVKFAKSESTEVMLTRSIASECFTSLLAIIERNHDNQIYIADRFHVILKQVKDEEAAVICVQEMLHNNLQMLQTKVRVREINIFLDLLEQAPMNVTVLKLLQRTCSCPMGVDSTQRIVAQALFGSNSSDLIATPPPKLSQLTLQCSETSGDEKTSSPDTRSHLLITAHVESSSRQKNITWSVQSIYCPHHHEDVAYDVMGGNLIKDGLPRIYFSWDNKNDEIGLGMKQLYPIYHDRVPYEALCSIVGANISKRISEKSTRIDNSEITTKSDVVVHPGSPPPNNTLSNDSNENKKGKKRGSTVRASVRKKKVPQHSLIGKTLVERKMQVLNYFCTQLYLVADLCLDRNYLAMNLVEKSYPFEMLVTMLKLPMSSNSLKAPVCRLIRCLYVDRDPQIEDKFPKLIRTSISLAGGEENLFADNHTGSPFKFGLLQQIISDYIHNELDTTNCDELSSEMIALLMSLMKFGFYNTPNQLIDIVIPLTKALDRHRYVTFRENEMMSAHTNDDILLHDSLIATKSKSKSKLQTNPSPGKRRSSLGTIVTKMTQSDSQQSKVAPSEGADNARERSGDVKQDDSKVRLCVNYFRKMHFWQQLSECCLFSNKSKLTIESERSIRKRSALQLKELSRSKRRNDIDKKINDSMDSSFYFTLFTIFLVFLATIIVLLRIYSNSYILAGLDILFAFFFFVELCLRTIFHYRIHQEFTSFVSNKYRILDILIVSLDVLTFSIELFVSGQSFQYQYFRVIRLLRAARLIRVGKLLKGISASQAKHSNHNWVLPARYEQNTPFEIKTITGILQILSGVHHRIQDKQLGKCIQVFSNWFDENIQVKVSEQSISRYAEAISFNEVTAAFPLNFNQILIDVAMYKNNLLSQEALWLLMLHERRQQLFLETCSQVQIIYSSKLQAIYKTMCEDLRFITNVADTFALWGLLSSDADMATYQKLFSSLEMLIDIIRLKRDGKLIDFDDGTVKSDINIQRLMHNLNILTPLVLLQHAILDNNMFNFDALDIRLKKLLTLSNEVIIRFMFNSEENQLMAYEHFEWFVSTIEAGINSGKVIRGMLSRNRTIIRLCPKNYIADFMDKIILKGRRPEYLELLIGLTTVNDVQDTVVSSIRSEISRYITSRDSVGTIICWCSPFQTEDYAERKRCMVSLQESSQSTNEDQLPVELLYHINLLTLLSGCKLGQKLEAVCSLEAIVDGILDLDTIYLVKRSLGILLIEIVELHVEGLEISEALWLFFANSLEFIIYFQYEFKNLLTHTKVTQRHQDMEWMNICLRIMKSFFEDFDFSTFYESSSNSLVSEVDTFETTRRTEHDVQEMIVEILGTLQKIRQSHYEHFGNSIKNDLQSVIEILCNLCPHIHEDDFKAPSVIEISEDRKSSVLRHRRFSAATRGGSSTGGSTVDQIHEDQYQTKFQVFLKEVGKTSVFSFMNFGVHIFLDLPLLHDVPLEGNDFDLRLEAFIIKYCNDIINRISYTTSSKSLDKSAVEITKWFMDLWTSIIETEISCDIEHLMDPNCELLILEPTKFQNIMNGCGVTELCLEVIALGMEDALCLKAIKLLIAILAKSGGNINVQTKIWTYLLEKNSSYFFEQIKELMDQQILWCQRESDNIHMNNFPESIMVLKLFHSMCEGNFIGNKDILREQVGNVRFINILDLLSAYISACARSENYNTTVVSIRVLHAMLGLVQGPCVKNQEYFVLHTNLLTALNRIIRTSQSSIINYSYLWEVKLEILKEFVMDLVLALIEGHNCSNSVVERVQLALELNVLNVLILPPELDEFNNLVEITTLTKLQAKYLVFIQSLRHYPTISISDKAFDNLVPNNAIHCIRNDISIIEIIWNNKIHKHVFHLPEFAKDMTDTIKRKLLDEVDITTQELKLKDFMRKAKNLFGIAIHQRLLKDIGLGNIWRIPVPLSWVMLINCLIINALLMTFYQDATFDKFHNIFLPRTIDTTVFVLVILQIFFSFTSLCLHVLISLPVIYRSHKDDCNDAVLALIKTFFNLSTLRYVSYLVFTILCLMYSYLFVSALLLDFIILDSTSKDVLFAVIYPFRQLVTSLAIILIMVNVFSGILFSYFRHEFSNSDEDNFSATSMWEMFKIVISYGLRSDGGIGTSMVYTTSYRLLLDITFYFIISVVLLNIFFGIIIDTFGKLRNLKVDRELNESNKCFICGTERYEYMKKHANSLQNGTDKSSSNVTEAFHHHRNEIHNMWNYLFFAMHIWEQTNNNDNSVEMYVRKCLTNDDISWFPIGVYSNETSDYGSDIDDGMQEGSETVKKGIQTTDSLLVKKDKNRNTKIFRNQNSSDSTTIRRSKSGEYEQLNDMMNKLNTKMDKFGIIFDEMTVQSSNDTKAITTSLINSPLNVLSPIKAKKGLLRLDPLYDLNKSHNTEENDLLVAIAKCIREELEPVKSDIKKLKQRLDIVNDKSV